MYFLPMSTNNDIPKNAEYVSAREAAEILEVSYYRIFEYIEAKRLPATFVGRMYMLLRKDVENFKAKPTGRVRKKPPAWRAYRAGSKLFITETHVPVREGQRERLEEKLKEMLVSNQHALTGTLHRYIAAGDEELSTVTVVLIWRDVEMPDEATRQQELAAFKQDLADLLDWENATENTNRLLLYT
jgi:excisionase family DNA binding protein